MDKVCLRKDFAISSSIQELPFPLVMVDTAEEEADLESSVPPDKMLHLLTLLPKIKSILFYLLYT